MGPQLLVIKAVAPGLSLREHKGHASSATPELPRPPAPERLTAEELSLLCDLELRQIKTPPSQGGVVVEGKEVPAMKTDQ